MNFFSLPRELRHKILQLSFDNFFYSSSYQKSLYGSWNVMKWTKNLRRVDKRLTEDLEFVEEIEYESWIQWNAIYLKECVLPGWVDEYEVAALGAFQIETKLEEEQTIKGYGDCLKETCCLVCIC
jgi:hypothetical protein